MRLHRIGRVVSICAAMALSSAPVHLHADPAPREILAPGGKLRVGLYPGTPTSILPDAPGGPRGVGYDLGKALAERLGVPFEPVVFAKNAEVLDAVKTGAVDAAFTNASASRAREMDFGPAYLESDLGYLVDGHGKVTAPDMVDAKGVHVGVTAHSSSDAFMSHELMQAEVVRLATINDAPKMLAAGSIDVFATNKATLFELAEKMPDGKVLEGRWGVERHAIAIPKGREQGMGFIRGFTEDIKAHGQVEAAIARSGLRAAAVAK